MRTLLVMPCFNEAQRLDVAALEAFTAKDPTLGFVLVDDGSSDATKDVITALAARAPEAFQTVILEKNQGKAEAVRQGVLAAAKASPAYIGYWDADLATPLEAIPGFRTLLDDRPELQLVMGSRIQLLGRSIRRSTKRHYLGRVFATAASRLLCLPVYDTQCGAKLFRATPAMLATFEEPWLTRWLFDVELIARMRVSDEARGGRPATSVIYELPLDQWHDVAGSKVRGREFLRAGRELWRLWWKHHGACKRAHRKAKKA